MAFDDQSAMTVILGQFVSLTYYNFPSRTAKSDIKVKIVGSIGQGEDLFYNIVTYYERVES